MAAGPYSRAGGGGAAALVAARAGLAFAFASASASAFARDLMQEAAFVVVAPRLVTDEVVTINELVQESAPLAEPASAQVELPARFRREWFPRVILLGSWAFALCMARTLRNHARCVRVLLAPVRSSLLTTLRWSFGERHVGLLVLAFGWVFVTPLDARRAVPRERDVVEERRWCSVEAYSDVD